MSPAATLAAAAETELARRVRLLSMERWRGQETVTLIGQHEQMIRALERVHHFAQSDAPVLVTGETGTGKELFARALYLLSARGARPFVRVNCAQYRDNALIASELFGHKRGSFTGAVADHRGLFEEADGGVIFLDEIGELAPAAQAMLLRALSEGEIVPVGSATPRRVNVRVVAATNRDLGPMVAAGEFRSDLYYRLSFLQLDVTPLRDRGADWKLMLEYYVHHLNERTSRQKRFSEEAVRLLEDYHWPGNVRELRGMVEMGHCLSNGSGLIEAHLLEERLLARPGGHPTPAFERGPAPWRAPARAAAAPGLAADYLARMAEGDGTFWELVYEPFMDRDLNRGQVRAIVAEGLRRTNWSYTRALEVFGVEPDHYLKFMDFLRHHRLKPER
ncbi:MAG TPA: sigma 54-interacting transcriptional regulator [Longimicrobiaceae bacterium]|nr:sigma 54-interacting transcriptional regulator [Longimicrobiaceae bacterium]